MNPGDANPLGPGLGLPLLALAAVVVLIPLVLWLVKRSPLGFAQTGRGLRLVASLALSPNQRVVTVEVGTGDERRWLVLGVSPGGIQPLHNLSPQPEPAAPLAAPGFAQLLARARGMQAQPAPTPATLRPELPDVR